MQGIFIVYKFMNMKKIFILLFMLALHLESISQKFGLKPMDSVWIHTLTSKMLKLNETEFYQNYYYYDSAINAIIPDLEIEMKKQEFKFDYLGKNYTYNNYLDYIEQRLFNEVIELPPPTILPTENIPIPIKVGPNGILKNNTIIVTPNIIKLRTENEILPLLDSIKLFSFTNNDTSAWMKYKTFTDSFFLKLNLLSADNRLFWFIQFSQTDIEKRKIRIYEYDSAKRQSFFYHTLPNKNQYLEDCLSYLYKQLDSIKSPEEKIWAYKRCSDFYAKYDRNLIAFDFLRPLFNIRELNLEKNKRLKSLVLSTLVDLAEKYPPLRLYTLETIVYEVALRKGTNIKELEDYDWVFYHPNLFDVNSGNHAILAELLSRKFEYHKLRKENQITLNGAYNDFMINNNNTNLDNIFFENSILNTSKTIYLSGIYFENTRLKVLEGYCLVQIYKGNWELASNALKKYGSKFKKINSLQFLLSHVSNRITNLNYKIDESGFRKLMSTVLELYKDTSIVKTNEDILYSKYCWTMQDFYGSHMNNTKGYWDSLYMYGYYGYTFNKEINFEDPMFGKVASYRKDIMISNLEDQTDSLKLVYDKLMIDYSMTLEKRDKIEKINTGLVNTNSTLQNKIEANGVALLKSYNDLERQVEKTRLSKAKEYEAKQSAEKAKKDAEFWKNRGLTWKLFALGILLSTFLIIFFGTRHYIKKINLKKLEASNLKLKAISASLNPHFIKGTINTLETTLKENTLEENEKYFECFNTLVTDAYEHSEIEGLVTIRSEIILIKKLIAFYNCTSEHKNNKIIPPTEEVDDGINIDLRIPKMLLFNYVENSVTKAFNAFGNRKKKITIVPKIEGAEILIDIIDTGGGFPIEKLSKGHNGGIQKTQAIIDNFNAQNYSYAIKSNIDSTAEGTHVKLTFIKK